MQDKVHQVAQSVGPAVPPTAVTGLSLYGVPLADWVLLATLVYTLILIVTHSVTLWQKVKGWCKRGS